MPRFDLTNKRSYEDITREHGASGTIISDGYIWDADYNNKLDGAEAIDVYREMLSDTTVKLCIDTIELNVLDSGWTIQPAMAEKDSDIEIQEEIAKDINTQLMEDLDTPWQEVLRNMMPYRYGVSLNEILYDEDALNEGKLVIKDIRQRLPETIERWITKVSDITATNIDKPKLNEIYGNLRNNQLIGVEQMLDDGETKFVPKDLYLGGKIVPKLFVVVNEKQGDNYWGKSELRSAYREWYYKDKLIKFHGIMAEKVATPMAYAIVSPDMDLKDKQKIKDSLANAKANQERYIYIESSKDQVAEVGYMDMQAGTLANALDDSKVYSQRIAESMDLNWKTDEGKGSQAKDRVRYADFIKRENVRGDYIAGQFNRQVLVPIIDYNYEGLEERPSLTSSARQSDTVSERSGVIKMLVESGVLTPDNDVENTVRKMMGFEELPEDFERTQPQLVEPKPNDKPEVDKDDEEDTEDTEEEVEMKDVKLAESTAEKKKTKKALDDVNITPKESSFLRSINKEEGYLQDKYNEFEARTAKVEKEISDYVLKKYEKAPKTVENGIKILKPNVKLSNELNDWVDNKMKSLEAYLTGEEMNEIHKTSRENAQSFLKDNGNSVVVELAMAGIGSYIGGYLSNVKAWIFNEGRRIKERVFDNLRQGVQYKQAIAQAKAISLNRNILKLSVLTHPRALYRKTIQEKANQEGVGVFKMMVPDSVFKKLLPFGMTLSLLYMLKTAPQWNDKGDEAQNTNVVGGLGLHHGSQDYYLPISDEELSKQDSISREQRKIISELKK